MQEEEQSHSTVPSGESPSGLPCSTARDEAISPAAGTKAGVVSGNEVAPKEAPKSATHPKKLWTQDDLTKLVGLWCSHVPVEEIASTFGVSRVAVNKMVTKLRQGGIPIPRRKAGTRPNRHFQQWTQQEVEYLVRRLAHRDTHERIALDLGRTHQAVQMMAGKLRSEGAPVKKLRGGRARLWDAEAINIAIAGKGLINDWEFDGIVPHDAVIQDTAIQ